MKNQNRTRHLKIRLTEAELDTIEQRAGSMTKSAFVRECAIDRMPTTLPQVNERAIVQLNKIGVNLNQLTRLAHKANEAELQTIMDAVFAESCLLVGAIADLISPDMECL
jgi:hypothetical protein